MRHAGWSSFGEELRRQLESLPLGDFHVVESGTDAAIPSSYVQFKAVEEGIWCEAVSDVYLRPHAELGRERTECLQLLGWKRPGSGGNWWVGMDGPDRFTRCAELAVNTLVRVYGAATPASLHGPTTGDALYGQSRAGHVPGAAGDDADVRIAAAACEHGTYLGRDGAGLHRMELLGESIRLRLENLGSVAVMHIAVALGSVETVDPAVLRRTRPGGHPSAADPRLAEVTEKDGSVTFWLTTSGVVDLSPTRELRLMESVQALVGPARRLRTVASIHRGDNAA